MVEIVYAIEVATLIHANLKAEHDNRIHGSELGSRSACAFVNLLADANGQRNRHSQPATVLQNETGDAVALPHPSVGHMPPEMRIKSHDMFYLTCRLVITVLNSHPGKSTCGEELLARSWSHGSVVTQGQKITLASDKAV